MKHQLSLQQLEGFDSQSVLASFTKDFKKLCILSTINSSFELESNFIVKKGDICLYRGKDLKAAINQYNEI
jgi:hypothetical protein